MSLTRRKFLEVATALGVLSCGDRDQSATTTPDDASTGASDTSTMEARFDHGVASGDPLSDRVILWTRVSGVDQDVDVDWDVGLDPALHEIVASGTATARADSDFTVKVDATGLQPGRTYHYRFSLGDTRSPTGRTKTLPVGDVSRVRFALASCSSHVWGYFNGYAAIARREDLDAVLHLGDYIYEHGNGTYGDGTQTGRIPEPNRELINLDDYRQRYAQYRTDPDLQEAHRRHPFIAVWDDHESANNAHASGAQNHQPDEGDWETRRDAAIQAYFEWLPIRNDHAPRIWREFRYGNLVDLLMLDTRLHGRDVQVGNGSPLLDDPTRTILGEDQEQWLTDELEGSAADGVAWRALGQQVLMGQLLGEDGKVKNTDMWSGYDPSRRRLLEAMSRSPDVVVFSGDVHSSWAVELTADPFDAGAYDPQTSEGAVAVEIVAPAITSAPPVKPEDADSSQQRILQTHPHVKWVDLQKRGYVVVDIDPQRIEARWFHLDTIDQRSAKERLAQVMVTRRGRARLEPA